MWGCAGEGDAIAAAAAVVVVGVVGGSIPFVETTFSVLLFQSQKISRRSQGGAAEDLTFFWMAMAAVGGVQQQGPEDVGDGGLAALRCSRELMPPKNFAEVRARPDMVWGCSLVRLVAMG